MSCPIHVKSQFIHINVGSEHGPIFGYTDIEFEATLPKVPKAIMLNARQVKIKSVSIGKLPVSYQQIDSHAAFLFESSHLIRDATQFCSVSSIVLSSPDLIIPFTGPYPVTVHIEFDVNEDSTAILRHQGITFTDNRVDGPSGWFPCLDTRAQRSAFSLSITFPQHLVCVGPGEGTLQAADTAARTNTMAFRVKFPVAAESIGFAIGPFSFAPIGTSPEYMMYFLSSDGDVFRRMLELVPSVAADAFAMLGFPADEPLYSVLSFASVPFLGEPQLVPGVVFLPGDLLVPQRNLNVRQDALLRIIETIYAQVITFLFPVADPEDEWLPQGLVAYLAQEKAAQIFSVSYKEERRWREINWLMGEDIHQNIVLHSIDPATGRPFRDEYLRVKAKLLLQMIATSMRNNLQQLLILMNPLLKQSETSCGFVFESFLTDLQHFCPAINFKVFTNQWLQANGFPIFTFNFYNDVRRNCMKLILYQYPSTKTRIPFFTGQILVRLQDLEQPYDYLFQVENQLQTQQMAYFAHRKKTKKKKFMFQNQQECEVTVHHAVMWIVIDAMQTWICRVRPRMPGFMLEYELDLNRSVFAEHETLSVIDDFNDNDSTVEKLTAFLKNNDVYYSVRGHVCRVFAKLATEESDYRTAQLLLDWYKNTWFIPPNYIEPRPHNFEIVELHLLQCEAIRAISIIRSNIGFTPKFIIDFLILVFAMSNNNHNTYSDDHFNAEASMALGRLNPESETDFRKIISLICSKIGINSSIPSFQNVVASAGLTALTAVALKYHSYSPPVDAMKKNLMEAPLAYHPDGAIFRCLLHLALLSSLHPELATQSNSFTNFQQNSAGNSNGSNLSGSSNNSGGNGGLPSRSNSTVNLENAAKISETEDTDSEDTDDLTDRSKQKENEVEKEKRKPYQMVTFSDCFVLIYNMVLNGMPGKAAECLREIYRFVVNTVHDNAADKYEAYLLSIPGDLSREELVQRITEGRRDDKGMEAVRIAETLWTIMTKHSKHNRLLRSEALRCWLTIYGERLPKPYKIYRLMQAQTKSAMKEDGYELSASDSTVTTLTIVQRVPRNKKTTITLASHAPTNPSEERYD